MSRSIHPRPIARIAATGNAHYKPGKRESDRIYHERADSKQTRETTKIETRAEPLCVCGWITGRTVCPVCFGVRPENREDG